jgi:glutathione S-transferase
MLKLYAAPRTRAVRIVWLLEELGLPYQLEVVEFQPTTSSFFIQNTPTGKLPTLEDGAAVICESGAMVEHILERYGEGRLAPAPGTPERPYYLQWLHYAESTAFAPLGVVIWLTVYRQDAADHPALVEDARRRAATAFSYVNEAVAGSDYLVGDAFTAADIMMGFTLFAARTLGVIDDYSGLLAYLERISARPALGRTLEKLPL